MLRAGRIRYQSRRLLRRQEGRRTHPGSKSINGCSGPNACGNYDYDCDGVETKDHDEGACVTALDKKCWHTLTSCLLLLCEHPVGVPQRADRSARWRMARETSRRPRSVVSDAPAPPSLSPAHRRHSHPPTAALTRPPPTLSPATALGIALAERRCPFRGMEYLRRVPISKKSPRSSPKTAPSKGAQRSKVKPLNVVVTGGAGFIGSTLVDRLMSLGHSVTVVDNLSGGDKSFLDHHRGSPRFRFEKVDVRNTAKLTKVLSPKIDLVFHLAANADIARGVHDPTLDFEHSIVATFSLLQAMRQHGIKKLVYASGSGVLRRPRSHLFL